MTRIVRLPPTGPVGPFGVARPPMTDRYVIRSPAKAALIRAADRMLSLLPLRHPPVPAQPQRILLANWAHLGDLTITLGAVRIIRERFPDAHIGYLASSWGKLAIAQSGLADSIHIVDHWRLNRSAETSAEKRTRYRRTLAEAGREIRAIGYEVAIDFNFYFPPAHPHFLRWRIPIRIGYDGAGGGPLLTHALPWLDRDTPVSEQHGALLEAAWPGIVTQPELLRPKLEQRPPPPGIDLRSPGDRYLVIHPGAGATFKDWGIARWQALIGLIRVDPAFSGHQIVLTGAGADEVSYTAQLAAVYPGVIDMAGQADWSQFIALIANARAVICPDTVTGHIAAQAGTPIVSVFTGTNNPYQWAPNAELGRVVTIDVACAPCHSLPCAAMACIRQIPPQAVLEALHDVAGPGAARTD